MTKKEIIAWTAVHRNCKIACTAVHRNSKIAWLSYTEIVKLHELPYTEIEKLHELPYTKIVKSGTIGLAFDPNKNLLLFISSELAQKKKTKLFLYFEQKLKVETNYPSKTINMFLNLF